MTVLYYLVLILHLIACFFLIAVVLLQQGKGQDLASAFGGGGTQGAFGPRGSATLLSRVTTGLAAVFMITCLALTYIHTPKQGSNLLGGGVMQSLPAKGDGTKTDPAAIPAPAAPAIPAPAAGEAEKKDAAPKQ